MSSIASSRSRFGSALCAVAALLLVHPTQATSSDEAERIEAESSFERVVVERNALYEALIESDRGAALIREGRLAAFHDELRALVPADEKIAADYFILGNLLFRLDEEASRSFMEQAEAMAPDTPLVLFERGIHEHRAGACDRALPYYERFMRTTRGERHPVAHAYAAHCHLRLGQGEQALEAWSRASFGSRHVTIEKAMYEIFGPLRPEARRAELLSRIRDGEHELFGDLIALDSNYEIDWWNVRENEDYLAYDRVLAKELLDPAGRVAAEISLYRDLPELDSAELRTRLAEQGFYGSPSTRPPASGSVAYALARRLLSSGEATAAELLNAWEEDLQRKVEDAGADTTPYLDILAGLYASVGNREGLERVDEQGWKEHGLGHFAASYVVGRMDQDDFHQQLDRAIADFPEQGHLARLYLQVHGDGPKRQRALDHFVAAQFAGVATHEIGSRLNDFMASYAYESARGAPAKPAQEDE